MRVHVPLHLWSRQVASDRKDKVCDMRGQAGPPPESSLTRELLQEVQGSDSASPRGHVPATSIWAKAN